LSVWGDKQGRARQGGHPPAVFSYRQGRGRVRAARADTRSLFSVTDRAGHILYKSNSGGVCLSVWAVPGRFFQSLPIPCGASPYVTSPYVTDSREKRNQGTSDFFRQKIW